MLPSGPAAVSGYAVATMRPIVRVDVSADDGRRWRQAELQMDSSSPWAWTLWHTEMIYRKATTSWRCGVGRSRANAAEPAR